MVPWISDKTGYASKYHTGTNFKTFFSSIIYRGDIFSRFQIARENSEN